MDANKGTRPPTGSLEDIEASRRFMESLKKGRAMAPPPPPPSPQPQPSPPFSPLSQPIPNLLPNPSLDHRYIKPPITSLPPSVSSDGSGSFSSGDSEKKKQGSLFFLLGVIVVVFIIITGVVIKSTSPENKPVESSNQLVTVVPTQKVVPQIQTVTQPQSYEVDKSVASSNNQKEVFKNKEVIYATMFYCGNDFERENGYAMKNIHYVNGSSQALHVGTGCTLAQLSGNISKLEGKGYVLSVANKAIKGNFYNCGDVAGYHDSLSDCTDFVNRFSGKEMRIVVFDGGYVNLGDFVRETQVVNANTFNCRSPQETEEGYAENDIQYLDADSQSFHIELGCIHVKINGSISKLEGNNFELSVAESDVASSLRRENYYFRCGDLEGLLVFEKKCNKVNFLNQYKGLPVRVRVETDGYVNIN